MDMGDVVIIRCGEIRWAQNGHNLGINAQMRFYARDEDAVSSNAVGRATETKCPAKERGIEKLSH